MNAPDKQPDIDQISEVITPEITPKKRSLIGRICKTVGLAVGAVMALTACSGTPQGAEVLDDEEYERVGELIDFSWITLPLVQDLMSKADPLFTYDGELLEDNGILIDQTEEVVGNLEDYYSEGRIFSISQENLKPYLRKADAYHTVMGDNIVLVREKLWRQYTDVGTYLPHESAHFFQGHTNAMQNYATSNFSRRCGGESTEYTDLILDKKDFAYLLSVFFDPASEVAATGIAFDPETMDIYMDDPEQKIFSLRNWQNESIEEWAEHESIFHWCLPNLGISQQDFYESIIDSGIYELRQERIAECIEVLEEAL